MESSSLPLKESLNCVKVFQRLTPEIRRHWAKLATGSIYSPYQSIHWYEAWLTRVGLTQGEEPFIVVAFDTSDTPTLILPLVIARRGLVAIARFPGGKHANYNFPLVRSDVVLTDEAIDVICTKVAEASISVDLYWFDALPSEWIGRQNPLVRKPHTHHPAVSSVLDLKDDGLTQRFSLGRRASDRRLRKLGAAVTRAWGASEVETALRVFFTQKAAWFRARRLPNGFEQAGLSRFFQDLFSERGESELHVLSLGGEPLAIAGMLVTPERASLMFISYDQHHKQAKLSPGTHLLRWLVNDLVRRNVAQFDFGLGDAEYKRLLGARTEPVFVSMKAMTAKGRAAGAALALTNALKGHIKRSPRALQLLQSLHRGVQVAG